MRLSVASFRCPKLGNSEAEYEDAIATNKSRLRFAVADGASESSFARLWAGLLVKAFVRGQITPLTFLSDIAPLQVRWLRRVGSRSLPWYTQQKVATGAFAAFAGLSFESGRKRVWRSVAVGDCCMLQTRGDRLLHAFPMSTASEFTNRPLLVGSNPTSNLRAIESIQTDMGKWERGDGFLLASDAMAAYLLGRLADEGRPLSAIITFGGSEMGFRAWIDELRASRAIRNDDISLMVINL